MSRPLPDLQLHVSESRRDGQAVLCYRLEWSDPEQGQVCEDFESRPFRRDPASHFKELFRVIEKLSDPGDAKERHRQLENVGAQLFKKLLPLDLQRKLWALPRSIRTVQIVSDEAWIPWELLKLQDPDSHSAGPFFAEAFALSRWLRDDQDTRGAEVLGLHRIALVVPKGSQLASADDEGQLAQVFRSREREVDEIPARYLDVTEALGLGRYGGWHFAGHGLTWGESPDQWSVKLDQGKLTATDLAGEARRLGRSRPLVFLNACDSARGADSLTGRGGLACAFVEAGAGAFLGSYWALPDDRAHFFAVAFYERFLKAELPIGEAVRQARMRLREEFPGDPTWLAYTVFAHPLARCSEASGIAPALINGTAQPEVAHRLSGSAAPESPHRQTLSQPEVAARNPPEVTQKQLPRAARGSVARSPHRMALIAALIGAAAMIVAALITSPWLGELWPDGGEQQMLVRVAEQSTGAGIRGAEVLLFAEGGPYQETTDTQGVAELPVPAASVTAARLVVQSAEHKLVERLVHPSRDRLVDIRLSPRDSQTANVLFRIVDGTSGEPITNGEVQLFLGADPHLQTTDANGLVKFAVDFQDGHTDVQMSVRTPTHAIQYLRITLSPDTVQDVNLDRRTDTLASTPPASTPPAPTYEVVLVLPSVMDGAEILVDGRPPAIVRDLGTLVTIRVVAKDSNHHLEVRKGERICSQKIRIEPDTSRLQPCG